MATQAVLDRTSATRDTVRQSPALPYRLLVADDQHDVIEALRLLLTSHGFSVVAAATPAEAIAAVTAHPIDAALVDLNYDRGQTTGEQGLELVAALRSIAPGLPIVAMTAWSSIGLALEAMNRGAKDFIEKPFDETRLVAMLKSQAELGAALRRVAELEVELRVARSGSDAGAPSSNGSSSKPFTEMRLLDVEGTLVKQAMAKFNGNISRAARALGLSRSALYRRLERHKITN